MKTLLAVYGSPRAGGNTDSMLDLFQEGVDQNDWTLDRAYLRELTFSHCTECSRCAKTGTCVIMDDMQPFYDRLLTADGVVFSLPVFFLGPPAVAKAFIDRAQALWYRKFVLHQDPPRSDVRRGFLLSAGGFKSDRVFSCNKKVVKAFFSSCNLSYGGEILLPGMDDHDDVRKREDLHQALREGGADFTRS